MTTAITQRRNVQPLTPGVTGILRAGADARLTWQSHEAFAVAMERGFSLLKRDAVSGWRGSFVFRQESIDESGEPLSNGLRPPQLGALFAIGAHWSLEKEPATVVMPTGTGKTEIILATLVRFIEGTMLIVVPHRALLDQTVHKCLTLGKLPSIGVLPNDAPRPVVGTISSRPTCVDDLAFLEECNVVVAVVNSVTQGLAADLISELASRVDCLVLDEAHHVAAETWKNLRDGFKGKRVLQLTATPFRRDGRIVDGKEILNYPLGRAQIDGYFKPINFIGLYESDPDRADRALAEHAAYSTQTDHGFHAKAITPRIPITISTQADQVSCLLGLRLAAELPPPFLF